MLRNFRGTMDSSPKNILVKEKIVRQASEKKLSLAENNLRLQSPKAGFEPLPSIRTCFGRQVSLKNPVWQRRLLVPIGSCTRKTLAIGR